MKDLNVGPLPSATTTGDGPLRTNEDGCLVTADGHGRYHEACSRGHVFSVTTPLASGTTVVAGNVAPPAAAAATVLSLLNPVGSGINLSILQGWIGFQVAPTNTFQGAWFWCAAQQGVLVTAAEATAVKRPCFCAPQTISRVKAWCQAALTGGRVHTLVKPFPFAATGNSGSGLWEVFMGDTVDGAIVVPPGAMITLAPAQAGSGMVIVASIVYAEVPLPAGATGSDV